ncbi:nuclear transport factor 2 family protein [Gordonia aichiensis]|uniref:SnoaL-like domain-containing protein n=1 Tax=Gordonia aichiensis NBRC 108223 TaxID=1220583 RepID=L7KR30_9ACTN|nr:nuclear transport factor 2 family protein [Gordonia aichiensis]GAC50168.1 hypothetical protein GOACH_21_00610 [Gordonia aichiensis NBRC 108223]
MDVQTIGDTLEIRQLLTRYSTAVDARDWTLYRSVFTDDAEIDYTSSPFGITGGVDDVVDWLERGLSSLEMTMHYVMNIDVEIRGDTASVRAQFFNLMQIPGLGEQSSCGGYYHHELTRTDDGWRSRSMREEIVWFVNSPVGSHR